MHYLYKGRNFPVVWHFTFYRDFQRLSGAESFDRWVAIGEAALRTPTEVCEAVARPLTGLPRRPVA